MERTNSSVGDQCKVCGASLLLPEDEVMNQSCYLVIAYRWGWTNNSQYRVGCWTDQATAEAFAAKEHGERAGTYGVTVYELAGEEEKMVRHFPSSYDEKEAHWNRRIALFERFGNVIVPIVQGEATGDVSLAAMEALIEEEEATLDIFDRAYSPDKPATGG